ncbi:T9SS type A sorting domain-containing protein [Dyadobacter sp. CY351]|uniref:T9SS type A sorting domain-containing protein n=1 Tax=Dyadobacter sp. CY351 TaxID=2909337 RepID=UPI001F27679E|nr:T9SS type A sorting domain-containing protein [Dyadobacter sp. CY351]MCF2518451.1 T9SS type A sorting domain-containing protein [Dyadobacter sp. CY351]
MLRTGVCITYLLICLFNCSYQNAFSQQASGISTKRGPEIGRVTFGKEVISGVLGEGNFIDGYVRKKGGDEFIFPVGDNGKLRPFKAAADEITGAYFQSDPGMQSSELPAKGPFSTSSRDNDVSAVSKLEFWDIAGKGNTKLTLTWNSDSQIGNLLNNEDLSKLTIVGWKAGKWLRISSSVDNVSISGETSSLATGSITANAFLVPDDYSAYALGALGEGALPVVLASFHAKAVEKAALLEWSTASELNASHFLVERSANGKSWASIGKVAISPDIASGEIYNKTYQFKDERPLDGSSYYRLKMIDTDSSYGYSQIREIRFNIESQISVYPNPASDKVFLTGVALNQLKNAALIDYRGAVVSSFTNMSDGFCVSSIPRGIYILLLTDKNGMSESHKVAVER